MRCPICGRRIADHDETDAADHYARWMAWLRLGVARATVPPYDPRATRWRPRVPDTAH